MDVLCTDKTGTLTQAKIALIRHITLSGIDSERVLELAWLNSHFESGLRSPLDAAIIEHASSIPAGWTKIDEVPFDFGRRRVSVLLEHEGRRILVIKGAPEDVLKLSDRYELSGESDTQPFDATALARANKQFQTLCEEGFRVLGIAWREEPASQTHVVESDEHDFVFAGYAAFLDPPKASAGAAIAALESGGVDIKIITGDNERVTQYVGTQLGIPVEGLLTGTELNRAQ